MVRGHTINSLLFRHKFYRTYPTGALQARVAAAVVHVDGVTPCLWTAASNGPIVHPSGNIWACTTMVEWYRQRKTVELGEKPVPVLLCPPKIPCGLNQERTRASKVRGRRLNTGVMARPTVTGWVQGNYLGPRNHHNSVLNLSIRHKKPVSFELR
jgi:hypothetical protein